MKQNIKHTLATLAVLGAMALPKVVDIGIDGVPKVTHLREGIEEKNIFEYKDRIVVTGIWNPWGMTYVDEGKDGSLDEVIFHGLPSKAAYNHAFEPNSRIFQNAQRAYEDILREYQEQ